MLKIEDGELIQFRASSIGQLLRIVGFQFINHSNDIKVIHSTYGKLPSPEHIKDLCPEYFDRPIIATVFTGMSIEAFLFDYAAVNRSKTYAEKISNKKISDEYLTITTEVLNSDTAIERSIAQRLKKFNAVRNHFVHNKSTELGKYNKGDLEYLTPDSCVELLCDFFEYFSNADPKYALSTVILKVMKNMQILERGF